MFGFACAAMAPALVISRMVSIRKRSNPVKFLPMECGQVPSGEGKNSFHDAVLPVYSDVCNF